MRCAKSDVPCHECKKRSLCEILQAYLAERYRPLETYDAMVAVKKTWTGTITRKLLKFLQV